MMLGVSMKLVKIILLNFLLFVAITGSLVFLIVISSETLRFAKSKFLYKNIECIRASCFEAYKDILWAKKHFKEYSEVKFHYETPIVWRADSFKGDTINISENNFARKTFSKNKPKDDSKVIFFFGGSVVWGVGSNDENTLPSHFQNISGYKTKNFGENAWTSDQSLMYLIKLIKDGHRPDYVIFINGYNDATKCGNKFGDEHGILIEDDLRLKFSESIRKKSKITFNNFFSIPLEFVQRIKSTIATKKAKGGSSAYTSGCLKSNLHLKIAENLYKNWKIAKILVEDNGGEFIAIIEPMLAFTDTKIDPRINFNNKNVHTIEKKKIYSHLLKITKDEPYIYDFKSIYNSIDDYIFIDEVHVTPFANKFMANKIYNIILD